MSIPIFISIYIDEQVTLIHDTKAVKACTETVGSNIFPDRECDLFKSQAAVPQPQLVSQCCHKYEHAMMVIFLRVVSVAV